MKLTTKQTNSPERPAPRRILTSADLVQVTGGDVYMHNPRGSNDRLDTP